MIRINQLSQKLPFLIRHEDNLSYLLLGLWLLTMIALPIAWWTWGDAILPLGISIAALFQASAVFVMLQKDWGFWQALRAFLIIAFLSWGAEYLGSTTGFPFGSYDYTDRLQPQIFHVPALIPIAWFMLLPPAWLMGQLIVGKRESFWKHLAFVAISALALTAWDFFLDPQMVAWDFWHWEVPSGYFGIPWVNYLGWFAVAALITAIINPSELKRWPLALVYGAVWFLQSFGQAFFWGQIGPAIVGFCLMGGIMLWAYWRSKRQII